MKDRFALDTKETMTVAPKQEKTDRFAVPTDLVNKIETNAEFSSDLNPDTEARARRLSKNLNVPWNLIRGNEDKFEKKISGPNPYTLVSNSPRTAEYYKNFDAMAVSRDDSENLANVESVWDSLKNLPEKVSTSWDIGKRVVEGGNLYNEKLIDILAGSDSPDLDKRIAEFEAGEIPDPEDKNFIETGVTAATQMVPMLVDVLGSAQKEGLAGATAFGLGALAMGPTAPAAPAAAAIGYAAMTRVGASKRMFVLEQGNALREMLQVTNEDGEKIDPQVAALASIGVGAVNAGLEFVGLRTFSKLVPGGDKLLGSFTTEAIKKVVAKKSVQEALRKVLIDYGKDVTTETVTEVAQEVVTILGTELAKELSEPEFEQIDLYNEALPRLAETAKETFAAKVTLGLPITGVRATLDTRRVINQNNFSKKFDEIGKAVEATKTKERSPDMTEEYLDYLELGDVYLSAEGILEYFQRSQEEATDVLTRAGINPVRAQELAVQGVDSKAGLSKIYAQLTPEEQAQIRPDIKPEPTAFTEREAESIDMAQEVKKVAEQVKDYTEQEKSLQQTRNKAKRKIVEVSGYSKQYAEDALSLAEGFAERLGTDKQAFIEKVFDKLAKGEIEVTDQDGISYNQASFKSSTDIDKKWKEKGVEVFTFEKENKIYLETLIVPKEKRKTGVGTEVLNDLIEYADSVGKRIELTPGVRDRYQGTTSQSRLKKFYKRFGFVENKGRNKDFTTSKTMYREPKNPNILYQAIEEEAAQELFTNKDGSVNTQDTIPDSVVDVAGIESASKIANSKSWNKGVDLKQAMQDAVKKAAAKEGVDPALPSEQSNDYLVRVGTKDSKKSLEQNPEAAGWYDRKITQALNVVSLIHPEISKDEDKKLAFVWALAVTSNGMKVDSNFKLAEEAYSYYKKHGVMPTDVQAGQAQGPINEALGLFNKLQKDWGKENLRKFMLTEFTVSEIGKIDQSLKPSGEHVDVTVKGAAILGPKIGNGFFSNIYGDFKALTMDRWFIRTWGRWTGTLIVKNEPLIKKATERFTKAINSIDIDEASRLSDVIGVSINSDDIELVANAVQKSTVSKDKRSELNKTKEGEEIRKAGNSLAKYLDGQKEAPANPTERKYIRSVFNQILNELKQEYPNLTMADLQASLWYTEKRLYESAKVETLDNDEIDGYSEDEAPDYANAAAGLAKQKGIPDKKIKKALLKGEQDGRTTTARSGIKGLWGGKKAKSGEQTDSGGFTEKEKQFFSKAVAARTVRANRSSITESPWSYTRESDGNGRSTRLLKKLGVTYTNIWKPGASLGRVFRNAAVNVQPFYELEQNEANAAKFAEALSTAKAKNKKSAGVTVKSVSDYSGMRLFLSKEGGSGVAITTDGDIVSVFSVEKSGDATIELAIAAGGRKLDCYDTILPELYAPHGFVAKSRVAWDENEKPSDWEKKEFEDFNKGEPDVVFMVYDPAYRGWYDKENEGKLYADYNKAVAAQERYVKKVRKNTEYFQKLKGSIQIKDDNYIISLFKDKDYSTLVHELGHAFLNEYSILAEQTDDQQVKADYAKLREWLGVKEGQAFEREHHEKFAQGFERYLAEGKAPTRELKAAFRRFKNWLLKVYQNVQNIGVPLTPEVRSIFDRMFTTRQDAYDSAQANNMEMWTKAEMDALAVSPYEGKYMQDLFKASVEKADEEVTWRRNKDRINNDADWKDSAKKTVDSEPVYIALKAITQGGGLNGHAIETAIGTEYMDRLAGRYGKKFINEGGGVIPEEVAVLSGFKSVHDMAHQLAIAEDIEIAYQAELTRIQAENDQKYQVEDYLTDSEEWAEFMRLKQSYLLRAEGSPYQASPTKAVKQYAKEQLDIVSVTDAIANKQYMANAAKYSRTESQKLRAGKLAEASKASQIARLNFEKANIATKNREFFANTVRGVKSLLKSKSVTVDTSYQVRDLAARFGLIPRKKGESINDALARVRNDVPVEDRASISDWAQEKIDEGYEIELPSFVLDGTVMKHRDLTWGQFEQLKETFDQIKTVDRQERYYTALGDAQELSEVREILAEQLLKSYEEKDINRRDEFGIEKFLKGADAWTTKVETILRMIDGGEVNGVWWKYFIKPLQVAEDAEADRLRIVRKDLRELFKKTDISSSMFKKVFTDGMPRPLTKEQTLAVALNVGNSDNKKKLLDGWGWSEDQLNAILDTLEKSDWDFVQSIWDYIDTFRPESFAVAKKMTGKRPKRVEPEPVNTKFGVYKGGYYTLAYDPRKAIRTSENQDKKDMKSWFQKSHSSPNTKPGSHIERVSSAGDQVPLLSLDIIPDHIFDVVHDITHREAVINVNKIIGGKVNPLHSVLGKTIGIDLSKQFKDWLVDISNDQNKPSSPLHRIAAWARRGTTVVNMGLKMTTMVQQFVGATQSIDEIGPKDFAIGMNLFFGSGGLSDLGKRGDFIREKSGFMRNRLLSFDRDIRDATKAITPTKKLKADATKGIFLGIGLAQWYGVDAPTWMGAYNKYIRENQGQSLSELDDNAVDYADSVVRQTQGGGATKDLAKIQRGDELMRLFTMFYSYFNVLYNLGKLRISQTVKGQRPPVYALASMALLWFIPATLSEIVSARGPDDDEDWAEWGLPLIGMYPFQTVVGVRDVANAIGTGFGYQMTPAESSVKNLIWLSKDVWDALSEGETEGLAERAVESTGYLAPIPSKQLSTWLFNGYDLLTGEDDELNYSDLLRRNRK